jgi:inner membrane transporter RhtA
LTRRYASGVALAVCGVASVQVGAALGTTLFDEVDPIGAAFLRCVFAAALLMVVWRPRVRTTSPANLVVASMLGFNLVAGNVVFFLALDRIPLSAAVTIAFTGPLSIALAASRRPADALLVLVAAGAIVVLTGVATDSDGLDPVGVLFAGMAAAAWIGSILLTKVVGERFDDGAGLAIALAVGTLALAPFGVGHAGAALLDGDALVVGAVVGLLSSVVPYSCQLEALRRLRPGLFSLLTSLEPALAALVGLALLSQAISAVDALAIGTVITTSAIATFRARPRALDSQAAVR